MLRSIDARRRLMSLHEVNGPVKVVSSEASELATPQRIALANAVDEIGIVDALAYLSGRLLCVSREVLPSQDFGMCFLADMVQEVSLMYVMGYGEDGSAKSRQDTCRYGELGQ
jgi:hypothetical protein